MKQINSVNNPLIQYLKTLHQSKNRYHNKQFLVEGWYLVEEALNSKAVVLVFIDETVVQEFLPKINNVEVILITKAILKKISQNVSCQPIVALCKFQDINVGNQNNIVLLDNVQDPSNLGAILRNCAAFGVEKVFLSETSVDFYNHKVISASKGAIFKVAFEYCDLVVLINNLKKEGYYFYGTFLHQKNKPTFLCDIDFSKKNAFLFGNEGRGISEQFFSLIDKNFIISTTNRVESLNLAASIAITLYSLFIKTTKK